MAADEHFAAIDLGGPAGNGILVRFQFENMETYRAWNDLPEVQQLLAEIEQIIGYGYSRTSISMRRVASDGFTSPVTPRRNAPAPPPARPRTGERMASVTP
jgi:antibiotic biosynthesis monooxygenase (ABM) superfamily enzyme